MKTILHLHIPLFGALFNIILTRRPIRLRMKTIWTFIFPLLVPFLILYLHGDLSVSEWEQICTFLFSLLVPFLILYLQGDLSVSEWKQICTFIFPLLVLFLILYLHRDLSVSEWKQFCTFIFPLLVPFLILYLNGELSVSESDTICYLSSQCVSSLTCGKQWSPKWGASSSVMANWFANCLTLISTLRVQTGIHWEFIFLFNPGTSTVEQHVRGTVNVFILNLFVLICNGKRRCVLLFLTGFSQTLNCIQEWAAETNVACRSTTADGECRKQHRWRAAGPDIENKRRRGSFMCFLQFPSLYRIFLETVE